MAFEGKNSVISTKYLFSQRGFYKRYAFSERGGLGPVQVTDFTFAEYVNYGRVNTIGDVVYPIQKQIKFVQLPDTDTPIGLLPFVADAFMDLSKDFLNAGLMGKIPTNDANLSRIIPRQAYENGRLAYNNYISFIMEEYIRNYVVLNFGKILTIKDFCDHLLIYLTRSDEIMPLTFTSFQGSKYSSIFTSGLAVSITNFDFDDDYAKQQFTGSRAFAYYKNVCLNRGFSISHNSPWVLVADLGSPQMKKYYLKYRFVRASSIFNSFYNKTYLEDISLLKNNIIRHYNNFVNIYPHFKKNFYCSSNKLKSSLFPRKSFSIDNIDNLINNRYWINYYLQLRNFEEESLLSSEIVSILKISLNYEKIFDMKKAISYINNRFRETRKSKFGNITSIVMRNMQAKRDINPQP